MLQNKYLHIYPSQKYQQHFRTIKKIPANFLQQNANIFEHFKLVNIQRQTTYISSNYVKLKLIYTHTMHFLYLCSSIKYLLQHNYIFHQINQLTIRTTLKYIKNPIKKCLLLYNISTCSNKQMLKMYGENKHVLIFSTGKYSELP